MVEKVENKDTITLILSANDGIETEIVISRNAKVSDVIQKYRAENIAERLVENKDKSQTKFKVSTTAKGIKKRSYM